MKKPVKLFLCACFVLSVACVDAQENKEPVFKPESHEFIIHNFRTESGVTLPEAKIVYGT